MARRPRNAGRNKSQQDAGDSGAQTNTLSPEKVENVVDRIENLHKELGTEKSEYMLRCRDIRNDMKDVYTEAKDAGITPRALKAKIKERSLRAKATNCRTGLEGEQIDMFDQISQALGDLYDDVPKAGFTPPPTADRPFAAQGGG